MIKEKIIEIRQKNKLTQADFGKVLNIAQFTISRYDGTTRNIKQACTKHVPNMYQTCTKHVPNMYNIGKELYSLPKITEKLLLPSKN